MGGTSWEAMGHERGDWQRRLRLADGMSRHGERKLEGRARREGLDQAMGSGWDASAAWVGQGSWDSLGAGVLVWWAAVQ